MLPYREKTIFGRQKEYYIDDPQGRRIITSGHTVNPKQFIHITPTKKACKIMKEGFKLGKLPFQFTDYQRVPDEFDTREYLEKWRKSLFDEEEIRRTYNPQGLAERRSAINLRRARVLYDESLERTRPKKKFPSRHNAVYFWTSKDDFDDEYFTKPSITTTFTIDPSKIHCDCYRNDIRDSNEAFQTAINEAAWINEGAKEDELRLGNIDKKSKIVWKNTRRLRPSSYYVGVEQEAWCPCPIPPDAITSATDNATNEELKCNG